jgi:hypothetical protein
LDVDLPESVVDKKGDVIMRKSHRMRIGQAMHVVSYIKTMLGIFICAHFCSSSVHAVDLKMAFSVYVPDTRLYSPLRSGPEKPTFIAIRSADEWAAFWKRLNSLAVQFPPTVSDHYSAATQSNFSPPPSLDFTKVTLVVAATGRSPTSGYTIKLTSVDIEHSDIVVSTVETYPGRECAVIEGLYSPIVLGLIAHTDKAIRFHTENVVADCIK